MASTELQGVVEDLSLRRTKLRALTGEVIHVHNSLIQAVRVLPSGSRELTMHVSSLRSPKTPSSSSTGSPV